MTELSVRNMTCGHCVSAVTQAVKSIDPAAAVQVDLARARVTIEGQGPVERFIAAIEEAGYPAAPAKGAAATPQGGCCGSCG